jgi:hypothetical protein
MSHSEIPLIELRRHKDTVAVQTLILKKAKLLSVSDPGCLSQILGQKDPGSGSASKNLSIFNPKIVYKLPEI